MCKAFSSSCLCQCFNALSAEITMQSTEHFASASIHLMNSIKVTNCISIKCYLLRYSKGLHNQTTTTAATETKIKLIWILFCHCHDCELQMIILKIEITRTITKEFQNIGYSKKLTFQVILSTLQTRCDKNFYPNESFK